MTGLPPQSLFCRRAGDTWAWRWTTGDDASSWSDPVITIRASSAEGSKLLASTEGEPGVAPIDTTGTDFANGTFRWKVAAADTQGLAPNRAAVLQVQVSIDGEPETVMTETLQILPDYAVSA